MINLPTKILLVIKPMRTQFKFTLRLICTPEYKYTPEYIYTRVFFAHANWTYVIVDTVLWRFTVLKSRTKSVTKKSNKTFLYRDQGSTQCLNLNLILYTKTGVCRGIPIFLILFQNIDCGYSLEPPRRGGSSMHPQSMF